MPAAAAVRAHRRRRRGDPDRLQLRRHKRYPPSCLLEAAKRGVRRGEVPFVCRSKSKAEIEKTGSATRCVVVVVVVVRVSFVTAQEIKDLIN
jgi:hypothetical protein